MPINPNIALGVTAPQIQLPDPNSGLNALAHVMTIQGAQNQNALAQYSLSRAQRQDQESNALAQLMRSGVDLNTPEGQAQAYGAAPLSAASIIKQQLENRNITSQIGEREATAKAKAFERAEKSYGLFQRAVGAHFNDPNATPDAVRGTVQGLVQAGVMDPTVASNLAGSIPNDPRQLKPYLRQVLTAQMDPEHMLTVFAPKPTEVDDGQNKFFRDTNPNSPTYGQATAGAAIQKKQDPNSVASNATSLQVANLHESGANKRNAATIAAENLRAGITPDGSISPDMETTARAIASGQLPPPSGMALTNPKNQRILSRVMEINPQYDFTSVTAKKAAASAFTSGKEGAMMRSLQVAGQHLDQLGELADAMNNGNMQLVNKISNTVSQQTGSPAITNFDAAKEVVAKEVMKAIVAGGGGVGEREELAKTLSNAKSLPQLRGVITQYRNLMAAQHDALLQQRRAAGLSDSTLPNYTEGGGGGGHAAGVPPMSAIDAELARRAGK